MVGSETQPHESPRRREALDQVDLDARVLAREQCSGCVEGSRAGAHDRDSPVGHRRACYGRPGETRRASIRAMSKKLVEQMATVAGVVVLVALLALVAKSWW